MSFLKIGNLNISTCRQCKLARTNGESGNFSASLEFFLVKKELEWFQTMLPDLANATIEAFHFSSLSICRKEVSMSRISFSPLEPDTVKNYPNVR